MNKPIILSLCDRTGNWPKFYRDSGNYLVVQVELEHGRDVRLLRKLRSPVHGILASPPCTHFSRAGAWMWKEKGTTALIEGLALVDACLRAVAIYQPQWWCLENPIGRLQDYLGPPSFKFDPCDYGDPYTKRTWLWGKFNPPPPTATPEFRNNVRALKGKPGTRDRTTWLGSKQARRRSETPLGFARAFFEANP